MTPYNRIFIRDLSLQMHIGISPEERANKQAVVINVQADVAQVDSLNDDYDRVVCYAKISRWIRQTCETPVSLVETLAENIAAHVLSYDAVSAVRVQVAKPDILPDTVVGVDICRVK